MHYARGVVQFFAFLKEEHSASSDCACVTSYRKQKRYKFQEITRKKLNRAWHCSEDRMYSRTGLLSAYRWDEGSWKDCLQCCRPALKMLSLIESGRLITAGVICDDSQPRRPMWRSEDTGAKSSIINLGCSSLVTVRQRSGLSNPTAQVITTSSSSPSLPLSISAIT